MKTETPTKIRLVDYSPYSFNISHMDLDFNLDSDKTIVKSKLDFALKDGIELPEFIELDGEYFETVSIKINGQELHHNDYTFENNILRFTPPAAQFTFEAEVAVSPINNKALSGLYASNDILCTQCEAEGFRRITFFPDRPDVMTKFSVRLEADKEKFPILLSNGNHKSSGDLDNGRHFAQWEDPWLKPSYLFALVAGDLASIHDTFITMSGKKVALGIYAAKSDVNRIDYAMDSLKRSMKWDEETFGREYDLDTFNIVGVRDFNAGAMENKGLNIFNASLLIADKDTATDFDFANIERVIAHEYFHNWSGDRVTCRDWFQLSLKEGLTVFRDQEFSSDQRSRPVQRIHDVINLRARQFAEDAGPNAHSVRPHEYASIDNFYTATIYDKGAEVIRIAKNTLGRDNFLEACNHYFAKNDGTAATIEDWLSALRESSGNPLTGIEKWYSQAGTPNLEVSREFNAGTLNVKISQKTPATPNQPTKEWVPMPLEIAFFDKNGTKVEFTFNGKKSTEIQYNFISDSAELEFTGFAEKPVISILRGFTAPVNLTTDLTNEELAILAAFDDDTFNRWEALQTIARRELLAGADTIKEGKEFKPSKLLLDAYSNVMKIAADDYAYAALLLQLPLTNVLVQASKDAFPENIFAAREILAGSIYNTNKEFIDSFIDKYKLDNDFTPDATSAGLRSFAASCFYLSSFGDNTSKLYEYYSKANNMTDKMSLLSALSHKGDNNWQLALNKFYEEWHDNDLVLDKYFSNQAVSVAGNPTVRLKELLAHPAFRITNPNRVRSVIGAFAMSNVVGFNAVDGSGYALIAEKLLELDAINPMVASRIATAFERLVKIEPNRRKLAKAQLEQLLSANISKQMQEIVSSIAKSI